MRETIRDLSGGAPEGRRSLSGEGVGFVEGLKRGAEGGVQLVGDTIGALGDTAGRLMDPLVPDALSDWVAGAVGQGMEVAKQNPLGSMAYDAYQGMDPQTQKTWGAGGNIVTASPAAGPLKTMVPDGPDMRNSARKMQKRASELGFESDIEGVTDMLRPLNIDDPDLGYTETRFLHDAWLPNERYQDLIEQVDFISSELKDLPPGIELKDGRKFHRVDSSKGSRHNKQALRDAVEIYDKQAAKVLDTKYAKTTYSRESLVDELDALIEDPSLLPGLDDVGTENLPKIIEYATKAKKYLKEGDLSVKDLDAARKRFDAMTETDKVELGELAASGKSLAANYIRRAMNDQLDLRAPEAYHYRKGSHFAHRGVEALEKKAAQEAEGIGGKIVGTLEETLGIRIPRTVGAQAAGAGILGSAASTVAGSPLLTAIAATAGLGGVAYTGVRLAKSKRLRQRALQKTAAALTRASNVAPAVQKADILSQRAYILSLMDMTNEEAAEFFQTEEE